MSFVFEILRPAKKLQFSLINVTYFFIFVTNFHSHLLNFSFKMISFKMIYNMTIFEKFFFELPEVKGQFLPLPYENRNI